MFGNIDMGNVLYELKELCLLIKYIFIDFLLYPILVFIAAVFFPTCLYLYVNFGGNKYEVNYSINNVEYSDTIRSSYPIHLEHPYSPFKVIQYENNYVLYKDILLNHMEVKLKESKNPIILKDVYYLSDDGKLKCRN